MNNIDIIAEGVRAMSADINDQMREVPAIMEKLEKQLMFHYITGDVTVTPWRSPALSLNVVVRLVCTAHCTTYCLTSASGQKTNLAMTRTRS